MNPRDVPFPLVPRSVPVKFVVVRERVDGTGDGVGYAVNFHATDISVWVANSPKPITALAPNLDRLRVTSFVGDRKQLDADIVSRWDAFDLPLVAEGDFAVNPVPKD